MKKLILFLLIFFVFIGNAFSFVNLENINIDKNKIIEKEKELNNLFNVKFDICIGTANECIKALKTNTIIYSVSIENRKAENLVKSKDIQKYFIAPNYIDAKTCSKNATIFFKKKEYEKGLLNYLDCIKNNFLVIKDKLKKDANKYNLKINKIDLLTLSEVIEKLKEKKDFENKEKLLSIIKVILMLFITALLLFIFYTIFTNIKNKKILLSKINLLHSLVLNYDKYNEVEALQDILEEINLIKNQIEAINIFNIFENNNQKFNILISKIESLKNKADDILKKIEEHKKNLEEVKGLINDVEF